MDRTVGAPTSPRFRQRLAAAVCVFTLLTAAPGASAGDEDAQTQKLLKAAAKVRHAVVRIHWKNDRHPEDVRVRNAIVVSDAGHLLLAGPRPAWNRGTIYAEFADGNTVKASYVTSDPGSGLTLLHVNYRDLSPVRFLPLALATKPEEAVPVGPEPTSSPPAPANPAALENPASKGTVATLGPRPLRTLPLGLTVIMVTGKGAVAQGRIRAQDRRIPVLDPDSGLPRTVGALVEAGLAVVASDQGSPWLDEHGNVVALQLATGYAEVLPEQLDAAGVAGLKPRVTPSAALAIPASVLRVVTPRLLQRKPVPRAALGVDTRACPETTRQHLTDGHGCHVVLKVEPGGPAARAGLQKSDLIVRVDGEPLRPFARLVDILLPYRPGDAVKLGILRKGKPLTLHCELALP